MVGGIVPVFRARFSRGCSVNISLSVTYIVEKWLVVLIYLLSAKRYRVSGQEKKDAAEKIFHFINF